MPMRPISRSQTGVGEVVIPVNRFEANTSIQVAVTGTVTYAVDWTLDDPQESSPQWSDFLAGAFGSSAAGATAIDYPVRALRLNVTAGAGTATVKIMQAP